MSEDRNDQNDQDGHGNGAPSGNGAPAAAPATPEERLAAMTAERDDMKDRMLRIAAEFDNWKKRSRKEQTEAVAQARESVLKDVLEIADNLERATGAQAQAGGKGAAVDGAAVVKGVNLVLRLFQQKLERYEVRPFETVGQPFDPRIHEAISRVESAEVPAGAVAVELQKGYRIGDKLLRPAMVSVSTGPGAADGAGKKDGDGKGAAAGK
ncbi:MAG TPA: nucleotide exchange factor GrpE [Polyangia bacterium]|nr:nucleotide exchange factor GrpE [Polyangia bacterium]